AAHCTFVDYSASSLDLARGNADALGVVGQASFLRHDMRRVLRQKPQDKFTLIFLDAPYRNNLISQSLEWLIDFNCIDTDAFFVLEVEGDFDLDPRGSLTVHQQKIYGDTKVIFAQKRVIKYGAL
ncbi:MAG: RsmD family RNA methyltransferase, partial [Bdellovibrionales bacterium]